MGFFKKLFGDKASRDNKALEPILQKTLKAYDEIVKLDIDSLDFVDIVVIVEKKFGFKIKTEEMANVKTFNDFCDYIEKKIA